MFKSNRYFHWIRLIHFNVCTRQACKVHAPHKWNGLPSKLPHCALHWGNIHPFDIACKLNENWIKWISLKKKSYKKSFRFFVYSDWDKNVELAQLIQQKLDAYKAGMYTRLHIVWLIFNFHNIFSAFLFLRWANHGRRSGKGSFTTHYLGSWFWLYHTIVTRINAPSHGLRSLANRQRCLQVSFSATHSTLFRH